MWQGTDCASNVSLYELQSFYYLSSCANIERWQSPKSKPQIFTFLSAEPVAIKALSCKTRTASHKQHLSTITPSVKMTCGMCRVCQSTHMRNVQAQNGQLVSIQRQEELEEVETKSKYLIKHSSHPFTVSLSRCPVVLVRVAEQYA